MKPEPEAGTGIDNISLPHLDENVLEPLKLVMEDSFSVLIDAFNKKLLSLDKKQIILVVLLTTIVVSVDVLFGLSAQFSDLQRHLRQSPELPRLRVLTPGSLQRYG